MTHRLRESADFLHAVVDDGSWQRGREIADNVPPSDATQTEAPSLACPGAGCGDVRRGAAMSTVMKTEDAERRFDEALAAMQDYGRRTVEHAWKAGHALLEVKEVLKHGEWLPWLDRHGVNHRLAQRLMELVVRYPKCAALSHFETVDRALLEAKDPPVPTATSIQHKGKAAGQRASRKVQQRQEERNELRAAKEAGGYPGRGAR